MNGRAGVQIYWCAVCAVLFWGACAEVVAAKDGLRSQLFYRDVAPIIREKCAPCHFEGGPGPFPLTSYESVKKHAQQIAAVTGSRYMPPWLPEHGYVEFKDELRLPGEEIRLLANWVAAGAPEGPISSPGAEEELPESWRLGPPDLILKAQKAFAVPASGADVYWNFLLTPKMSRPRFVRAIDIRPSNPRIVHHANVIVDRLGSERAHSDVSGGFGGMEITVLRSPMDLDGHFLFWKPGAIPYSEPDGLAWQLAPGNDLILNMHLQPSGKAELEQPTIGLYFTDKPPTLFPYLLELENDGALDIPAGCSDFVVSDSLRLPVDSKIVAIYPHAHYLGTLLEAFALLPNGKSVLLIRIKRWDPAWQAVYRYREPVELPAGTTVTMRYHYDNSTANPRNPNSPPKRVQSGNAASDEMGHLWLELLPGQRGDARRIFAQAWAEHKLSKNPADYEANVTLGAIALSRLRTQAAIGPLREAVLLRPQSAVAHNLYGAALESTGQSSKAIAEFRVSIRCNPDLANARFNLAHALVRSGKMAEAKQNLAYVLSKNPDDQAAKEFLEQITHP